MNLSELQQCIAGNFNWRKQFVTHSAWQEFCILATSTSLMLLDVGIWYCTRFFDEHSKSMLFSSCNKWLEESPLYLTGSLYSQSTSLL